ncbi:MAG: hypothetical protein WA979_08895 [Pacificimonas sp.]
MAKKKSSQAGPAMTREQLKGADPKLAAAFIAFAEKLGGKAKAISESAESPKDAMKIRSELKDDANAFLKKNGEQD